MDISNNETSDDSEIVVRKRRKIKPQQNKHKRTTKTQLKPQQKVFNSTSAWMKCLDVILAEEEPKDDCDKNPVRVRNNNNRFDFKTVKCKLSAVLMETKNLIEKDPTYKSKKIRLELTNNLIEKKIDELARRYSDIAILGILFAHKKVNDLIPDNAPCNDAEFKRKPNFTPCFYRVVRNTTAKARERYAAKNAYESTFDNWLTEFDIQKRSQGPSNAFAHIANQFETNFHTNIETHWRRRLKNVFNFLLKDGKTRGVVRDNKKLYQESVYHTLKFLSSTDETSKTKANQKLVRWIKENMNFPDFRNGQNYFSKDRLAKKNWYSLVPGLIRLQRFIDKTNVEKRAAIIAEADDNNDGVAKKKRKRKRTNNKTKTNIDSSTMNVPTRNRNNADGEASSSLAPKKKMDGRKNKKRKRKRRKFDPNAIHRAKLTNFVVIPQCDYSMKHFQIDDATLFEIFSSCHLNKIGGYGAGVRFAKAKQFSEFEVAPDDWNRKRVSKVWYELFDLKRFETKEWKFGGTITTNSSDVSITLCRIKPDRMLDKPLPIQMNDKIIYTYKNKNSSSHAKQYDMPFKINPLHIANNLKDYQVFGIDLGIRNWAATVRKEHVKNENANTNTDGDGNNIVKETNILHKGRDFHFNTGKHIRIMMLLLLLLI